MQTPIEAEELLSVLRRSISQSSLVSQPDSAIHYVSPIPGVIGPEERLRIAYEAVKAEAAVFGSLPPSPPTVRARAALALLWMVNRLTWWQTAASKRFAKSVCEFLRVQMESQAEQHAKVQERLQAIEMKLQEIQKSID
jgi:hypothetical protein